NGVPSRDFTVGDRVHIEFKTTSNAGASVTVKQCSNTNNQPLNNTVMSITDNGDGTYTYNYDWNTSGLINDCYNIEVAITGTNIKAATSITLDSTKGIRFYSDPGYTNQIDSFSDTDTIYVEVELPCNDTSPLSSELRDWYDNQGILNQHQNFTEGTTVRFQLPASTLSSAGVSDGEWGIFIYRPSCNGNAEYTRAIKRDEGPCTNGTNCSNRAPTVFITPLGQTITTDGGSVSYSVEVTNNDSGSLCTDVTFNLSITDSNIADFVASSLSASGITVAPGSTSSVTLTVRGNTGATDGAKNNTYVTASEAEHTSGVSNTVTTTINKGSGIYSCSDCHGLPPKEGASRQVGTGLLGGGQVIGSHRAHVLSSRMSCTDCHVDNGTPQDSYPKGLGHRNKVINMVTIRGGSYIISDVDVDDHGNPVQDMEDGSGLGTCNNTACHGAQSPIWGTDLSAYDNCTICHGTLTKGADGTTINTNPELVAPPKAPSGDANRVGAHQTHLTFSNPVSCNECHVVPTGIDITGADGHLDGDAVAEINFGLIASTNTSPSFNYSTLSCSNVYCHSTVQANGGTGSPTYKTVLWNGSVGCGGCHLTYPGLSTGSHTKHTDIFGGNCQLCHYMAGIGTQRHVNKNIDVIIDPLYGSLATYSQMPDNPPENGYGQCENVNCHGNNTTPVWGTAGPLPCSGCHTNDMGMTDTVRRGIYKSGNDFTKTSHHISVTPSDASCEVC
ncbi:MAG: CxxxxCH/CxxCH domain-containing protein, partial [Nitrospirae bacterium]